MNQDFLVGLLVGTVVSGCIAAAFYAAYRHQKKAHHAAREWANANGVALNLAKQQLGTIHHVLERSAGGVGKRIAENREIAEALFTYAPAIYEERHGLVYLLQATDQFLVELFQLTPPCPTRTKIASSYSSEIYNQIHRAVGTQAVRA